MYGQFHNAQSIRTKKSITAPKNVMIKSDSKKMNALTFISLVVLLLSVSSTSFAGPSRPKLKGGNGNAQGR